MTNSMNDIKGEEYVKFGKNVTNARLKKNISQKQMANMLKIPQSTYAGYESGTRKVPLSIIVKLSKLLDVSPDDLIGTSKIGSDTLTVHGLEKDLVISYRNADEVDKTIVRRTLKLDKVLPNQKNA